MSERDGNTNQLFMNYKGFPALFLALGVFVFVRYACEKLKMYIEKYSHLISIASSCSFGVYLVHNLVLDQMARISFFVIIPLRRRRQSGILSSNCPAGTAVP